MSSNLKAVPLPVTHGPISRAGFAPVVDQDKLGFLLRNERIREGREPSSASALPRISLTAHQTTITGTPPFRPMQGREINQQAAAFKAQKKITQDAQQFLRRGTQRSSGQQVDRRARLLQSLSLQKARTLAGTLQGAKSEEERLEGFASFLGMRDANDLAERFYEAAGDSLLDLLDELGFDDEESKEFAQRISAGEIAVAQQPASGNRPGKLGFEQKSLAQALSKTLRAGTADQAAEQDRLWSPSERFKQSEIALFELESDDETRNLISHAASLVEAAPGQDDLLGFLDHYVALLHSDATFANKCLRFLDYFESRSRGTSGEHSAGMQTSGDKSGVTALGSTMANLAKAADLDMGALRREAGTASSTIENPRLLAVIESCKLVARMNTLADMVEQACAFMKRALGAEMPPQEMLRHVLQFISMPHSPPTAYFNLACKLFELHGTEANVLLNEFGKIFRELPVFVYLNEDDRAHVIAALQQARDEAARLEDEREAAALGIPEPAPAESSPRPLPFDLGLP